MTKKALFEKFDQDIAKRSRMMRFLLVLDQMGNVVFLNGSQDETISSHIHRRQLKGKATWIENGLCWVLKRLEARHCFNSVGE